MSHAVPEQRVATAHPTVAEAAEMIGVSPRRLSAFLGGGSDRRLSPTTVFDLLEYIDTDAPVNRRNEIAARLVQYAVRHAPDGLEGVEASVDASLDQHRTLSDPSLDRATFRRRAADREAMHARIEALFVGGSPEDRPLSDRVEPLSEAHDRVAARGIGLHPRGPLDASDAEH